MGMYEFKLILFFLSIFFPGYLLTSFLLKGGQFSFLFKLALAYGLGIYFVVIQIFIWMFVFGVSFSIFWFWLLFITEVIIIFDIFRRGKNFKCKIEIINYIKRFFLKVRLKEALLLLLILFQIIFLLFNAYSRPVATFDSVATWVYKAKILYFENQVELNDKTSDIYLVSESHNNYPWLVPLVQFWLFNVLGEFNEIVVNYIIVCFFVSVLIVLFYFLRRYQNVVNSLVLVFLLSSMPLFFYHGYNVYADLILAYYVLCSFGFLFLWLEERDNRFLAVSAIFLAITLFVKSEGVIFIVNACLLVLLNLFFKGKFFKKFVYFVGLIFLILSPWEFFRAKYSLGILNEGNNFELHSEVLPQFFSSFFITNSFNLWWFLVVLVFIFNVVGIVKQNNLLFSWLALILPIFLYLLIYLFTDSYLTVLNYTAIMRNLLTVVPLSVLVVGKSLKAR